VTQRILIVGCGYVGIPLGKELARRGHEVFGLRRSASAKSDLQAAGILPLIGDITRPDDLAKLPTQFDWVVQCVSSGGGDVNDYRRTYLEGTRNVLGWLASTPVRNFVYTSSTGVYGQNDGSLVDESSATQPLAGTAQILVETEKLLLDAAGQKALPAIILRVAGIYGPNRRRLFKPAETLAEGAGERIMNMIHSDDVVGCILATLERGRPGQIYNAVDEEPVAQRVFFEWLARESGKNLPPRPETVGSQRRGATNKRVSNLKLKTELGYEFKYPDFRAGYFSESD